MKRNNAILLISSVLLLGVAAGCAKQGYPSGGPVDRTPPKVIASTPQNGSNNFGTSEFTLQMDEYITIKDADNNILVSPPMKQKPEYVVRGRNVIVRMKDTLQENTTYLFQFKGAIVDFNEGNPLPSFEYVFSTGENIDSMTLRGTVLDALTLKPTKETVSVMAYNEQATDSAAALEQPLYVTRCDTGGHFAFNHIATGRYRLVAFVDGDRNLRLNAGEAVAFLDSAVSSMPMPRPKDTSAVDTTLADSTARYAYIKPDSITQHIMYLSLLKVEQQRVTGSKALSAGHFQIVTKNPLTSQYTLTHLMGDSTLRLHTFLNPQRDTLDVWTAPQRIDSLVLVLADTLLHDTLSLRYQKRAIGKQIISAEPEKLTIKSLVAQSHPYYDTLRLRMGTPVRAIEPSALVRVMDMKDSSETTCAVRLLSDPGSDTSCTLTAMIDFHGSEGGKYQMTLPAGMLTDIYGNKNDSLAITTTYTKAENYGTISLTVDSKVFPQLVQLLNEKNDIVRQEILTAPEKTSFPHLKAGKYTIRLVYDTDGDGHWTAGDYWQHRQPEKVIYFNKILDLRENWEIEEKWKP